MTEQELLQFIEEVEQEGVHQAPDYLKEMILRKAERMSVQEQIPIVDTVNSRIVHLDCTQQSLEAQKWNKQLARKKRIQLFTYSLKTIAATAAALMILFTFPQLQNTNNRNFLEENSVWKRIFTEEIQEKTKEAENHAQRMQENRQKVQKDRQKIQERTQQEKIEEKLMADRENNSVTEILNQGTRYVCNQLLTILEKENR